MGTGSFSRPRLEMVVSGSCPTRSPINDPKALPSGVRAQYPVACGRRRAAPAAASISLKTVVSAEPVRMSESK